MREMGEQGASLFNPSWCLASSQLLHQKHSEKWRGREGKDGKRSSTDECGRRWRGKEEDAALTIQRMREEGWEKGKRERKGGWRWRKNGNGGRESLGDRY